MSHTDLQDKVNGVGIYALPHGGYAVTTENRPGMNQYFHDLQHLAAFTSLPEALAWLERNMKQVSPLDDMSQGRTREEVCRGWTLEELHDLARSAFPKATIGS